MCWIELANESKMLSLAEAIKTGRLQEFIAQEEVRDISPVDRAELDAAINTVIKSPRSEDRTLRSPSRDGSTGK